MKKLVIVAFALIMIGKANAQSKAPSFGIKAGLNFSNIIKTDDSNFKTNFNTGYNAGVFLNLPVVDRLSFQPELMFSQKGYKSDRSGVLGDGTLTQTTNWIEIPILADVEAAKGFNIYIGPQVSFLTKTVNKYDGTFSSSQQTTYESDASKFKKSILGGILGIGINLNSKLSLNGRYALDFQKNNQDGTTSTPAFKNQVWQVGLGYKF